MDNKHPNPGGSTSPGGWCGHCSPGKTGMTCLVFNSGSNKAEVLLPGNESTGILICPGDAKHRMNDIRTLEIKSGFILKRDSTVMQAE